MPATPANLLRRRAVIAIAAVSGAVAAASGASPIGPAAVDLTATFFAIAAITWIAAVAPWWALAAISGLAMATVGNMILAALALLSLAASAWVGSRKRMMRVPRAVIAGTVLNVLLRSDLDVFIGSSAVIGCAAGLALIVAGTRRRTAVQRKWIAATTLALGVLAFLAVAGQAAGVLAARSTVESTIDDVRNSLDLLADGRTDEASQVLTRAAENLDWAVSNIDSAWTQPARLVPVVAQNRRALITLAREAQSLTDTLAEDVARLDLDELKPRDGRIDLDQVAVLAETADHVLTSVERLRLSMDDTDSVWLAEPLAREIDELKGEIDQRIDDARSARDMSNALPAILGAETPRRYFIAFTTPSEARGGGGFMGSWAEVAIDRGKITLSRTGRTRELNETGWPARRVTGPPEFLDRYGVSGFADPQTGRTTQDVWQVINLSPHFPSTGEVIAELYPQSGGRAIDGVFSLDAYALATLIDFSGPITVNTVDPVTRIPDETTLDGDNAAQFLLFDQYRLEETSVEREAVLEEITRAVVRRILQGNIPSPPEAIDQMLPLARSGRITAYSVHPDEQDLFERLHLDGALESREDMDALAVTFNNANGNKIDAFLDADISYDLSVDAQGNARSTATITLENSAPTTGWPNYTIGNLINLPTGWNRLWMTIHSRLPLEGAAVDGATSSPLIGFEEGLFTADFFIDLAPGTTAEITVDLAGPLDLDVSDSAIPIVLRLPAAVRPVPATITFTAADGRVLQTTVERAGTHRGLAVVPPQAG